MYKLLIGIEHLSTGVEFEGWGNITFNRSSRTTFWATSPGPFKAHWRKNNRKSTLEAFYDDAYITPPVPSDGEVKRVLAEYGVTP